GCSGTGTCKVTLNANTAVTATFTPVHTLTVSLAGSGSGSVTSSPAGIACGSTCPHAIHGGTEITLAPGATHGGFNGWAGGRRLRNRALHRHADQRHGRHRHVLLVPTTAAPDEVRRPEVEGQVAGGGQEVDQEPSLQRRQDHEGQLVAEEQGARHL